LGWFLLEIQHKTSPERRNNWPVWARFSALRIPSSLVHVRPEQIPDAQPIVAFALGVGDLR
jgi:hypothetical protein